LPSPEAAAHSREVTRLIHSEIQKAGGWIDLARFMELCLYAPGLGYYAGGSAKLGRIGDFVTAPEVSRLFGQTLAQQVGDVLRMTGGDVLELGAGSGALARDLLLALGETGPLPERYLILEVSAELRERQQEQLQDLPDALAARVRWLDALPAWHEGLILGNEVLDSLPVHLVCWREGGIYERGVTVIADGFAWEERPLRDGRLAQAARRLGLQAPYLSEINLAAPALIRTLAALLRRGAMLFVDYGFGEREYYHPQRSTGTLMCHYRQRAHDDAFFAPGLQDITAHVDFTGVAHAAVEAGLELLGYTTQAQFLINLGITDLLAQVPAADVAAYVPRVAGAQKLLSPSEMGELFKAIALGRAVPGPLRGFRHGDKRRLL